MGIQQALLIELEREKKNTARILNNLNEGVFDYKPHEKSMSVGELANHIVELHNWVGFAITKDVFDFHIDYQPSKLTTVSELLDVLENGYLANKKLIEEIDEQVYFENWTLKAGDYVIAEMPKAGALRFIITNHLIHHRGQLTVYLRLLNIPVPGIYGPSADDAN